LYSGTRWTPCDRLLISGRSRSPASSTLNYSARLASNLCYVLIYRSYIRAIVR
jgi:hypothetical protein